MVLLEFSYFFLQHPVLLADGFFLLSLFIFQLDYHTTIFLENLVIDENRRVFDENRI